MPPQNGPETIEVEATADTIVDSNATKENPTGETSTLAAAPEATIMSPIVSVAEALTLADNEEEAGKEEEATPTIASPSTSGTAATPASLRERVVAASRRGMDKIESTFEKARAKVRLARVLFGKAGKEAPAAGAAAVGEVGEGQGAAAGSELLPEAGAVMEGTGGKAVTSKPTRGFWARKARWASKRCTELKEKVDTSVTAAKQGAKGQLQALKKSFSRKGDSS
jgi:hypothetical protein